MKTLTLIEELVSFYKSKTEGNIDRNYIVNCNKDFLNMVGQYIGRFPHLLYPLCVPFLDEGSAKHLLNRIDSEVKNCYFPMFPSYESFKDIMAGYCIETPAYDSLGAIRIGDCFGTFSRGFRDIPMKRLNDYLLSLLISLPINKVNLTFIELGDYLIGDFFYKNISSRLYKTISDENDFKDYIRKLKSRMLERRKSFGNYPEYCESTKSIPFPYEIVILPEEDATKDWYSHIEKELPYFDRYGSEYGALLIFPFKENEKCCNMVKNYNHEDIRHSIGDRNIEDFSYDELIFINDKIEDDDVDEILGYFDDEFADCCKKDRCYVTDEPYQKLRDQDFIENIPYDEEEFIINNVYVKNCLNEARPLLKKKNLTENKYFLDACIKYINENAEKEEEFAVLVQDFTLQGNVKYEETLNSIIVPIGKANSEMFFRLDTVSHVHSFIIGQSGSGKSVFLHNIIGNAILKYAPEDLQLYLLDFKLGGVEFNRYRGIKHVKSLLVDNSDQQITLEILRELRERMQERGKQLRNLGVNNIEEYNKITPVARMPQILLIVDECHEMFRVGNDIPRAITNEISEIVTKIAKEGRSQGVHLIMATQTLSGTEISNEILNNISDHYLLKCASVDSERIVERSSEITSKLQTGQIYYHHVDNQVQFQAYYTSREDAASLIELAKEKAKYHKSNGEFYFNGAQLFKLDNTCLCQGRNSSKYPTAYIGKNISIKQNDLDIRLKKDYSENILLLGLNDMEQVTRTTFNMFLSLILTTKHKGMNISFKVLNCLSNGDSVFNEQLELLEEKGLCEIYEGRKDKSRLFSQLVDGINHGTIDETILLILGQERFRELKMDMEFEHASEKVMAKDDDAFGFGDFNFSNQNSMATSSRTFKEALELILDKGPELGLHTIMQLDKPSNFLFSDFVSPKMIYQKFKHLIMLKSDETASVQLRLNDNVRLDTLSKELERLRAYYYSEESDSYTLFTPYMTLSNEEVDNLINSI